MKISPLLTLIALLALAFALVTLYAAVWTGIFLLLAWFGFRRKNLTT